MSIDNSKLAKFLDKYGSGNSHLVKAKVGMTIQNNTLFLNMPPVTSIEYVNGWDMYIHLDQTPENQLLNQIIKEVFDRGVVIGQHLKSEEIIRALGMEK